MIFALQAAGAASQYAYPTTGPLNPTAIVTFGTVLVSVIGALAAGTVQVIRELHSTKTLIKENAAVGAAVGKTRDEKLDRIAILVNGRYSDALQELATVRQALADITGKTSDRQLAALAQQKADDQHSRVRDSLAAMREGG